MVVYKYNLAVGDTVAVTLPKGARPVSVGFQGIKLRLWALVDPNEGEKEERFFQAAPTGEFIKDDAVFIGSAQTYDQRFVYHVFEFPG
jgi:hypothetical protein